MNYFFRMPLLLLLSASVTTATAGEAPLDVARRLGATRYQGWTYGNQEAKRQVDCVQFVGAVVEDLVQKKLSQAAIDSIYIRGIEPAQLAAAVSSGDKRTTGIQYGLTDILRKGVAVVPTDAKPGDFIQYWMKKKDGSWFGHAGIIEFVRQGSDGRLEARIFGSHKSSNGIATSDFWLQLQGPNTERKIYLARFVD